MMLTFKSLKILLILVILFDFSLYAQNNNRSDEPISKEHYDLLINRKELIEKENSTHKNEWSGAYQFGDHHPTTFIWSPNHGFVVWGSHHTFFPSRLNFGNAEFLNNRLIIKPEIGKSHLNFQYIPAELTPVKWGEQHFLVSSDRLIDFAYAVHSGAESQIVEYLAKSEDYQRSRNGLPKLPEEYSQILRMKAIKPKIIAVKNNEDNVLDSEVTLDLGKKDKLIEGMIFYNVNSLGFLRLVVTDLQETHSKAQVIGVMGSSKNDKTPTPKVGMRFTSKLPSGDYDF